MNQETLWSAIVKDMKTREQILHEQLTEVITDLDIDMNDLFHAKYSEIMECVGVETFPDFDDEGVTFFLPNTTKSDAKILNDIIIKQGL